MAEININKVFVTVPSGSEAAALTASSQPLNAKKIYFFADGRIVNAGKEYSIATTDYAAVKAAVTKLDGAETVDGSVRNLINGAKDELNGTISGVDTKVDGVSTRVAAIETLIGKDVEDADTVINTVREVLDWFTNVQETDKGAQLIADVAANKTAIGTKAVEGGAATGLYKEIENAKAAAIAANTAAIEALDVTDTAAAGQYVSAVSQTDGKITVTREALPTLSVKTGSETYVGVNNHEVEIKTSALGSVGITLENGTWTAGTATSETGLATAADVATEIANDELVIAAALNDHETRLQTAEADITTAKGDITTAKADIAELKAQDKVHTTVADNTGNYVRVSTNAGTKVVTIAEHVVNLADVTESNTGIADAKDVKTYIDTYDFWETYTPAAQA